MSSRVLLGVTGGIAAYKAAELCRLLTQAGFEVTVAMTRSAQRFVGPATFAALSGRPVLTDEDEWSTSTAEGAVADGHGSPGGTFPHLDAARSHDVLVIAPATANALGRLSAGLADDVLSSTYLAFRGPVVVAPAMNTGMWDHPAVRRNLRQLQHDGVHVVEPASGLLACGDVGAGRLAAVEDVFAVVERVLRPDAVRDFEGLRVLVTAGGTREPIDAVRCITNRSSGRMGIAIAQRALARGARVDLVVTEGVDRELLGGIEPAAVVETAGELGEVVDALADHADVVVMAAAVSDFTVRRSDGKVPRLAEGPPTLELSPTRDILGGLGQRRAAAAAARPLLVGFAAEWGDGGIERARQKLQRKGVDMVVHNDVSQSGIGFDTPDNEITVLTASDSRRLGRAPKLQVADGILDGVASLLAAGSGVLR